jgi:hypothetical protein
MARLFSCLPIQGRCRVLAKRRSKSISTLGVRLADGCVRDPAAEEAALALSTRCSHPQKISRKRPLVRRAGIRIVLVRRDGVVSGLDL